MFIKISKHATARMKIRGIKEEEVIRVIKEGDSVEAQEGYLGRKMVFLFQSTWESRYYEEKEVTVIYAQEDDIINVVTVKSRYGRFTQ